MAYTISVTSALAAGGRHRIVDVTVPQGANIALITCSTNSNASEWAIFLDRNLNDLSIPTQPTLVKASTGGTIAGSTKVYVRITAVDANGLESQPSDGGKLIQVDSGTNTNKVTATLTAVSGATSYNVYVGSRPGMLSLHGNTTSLTYIIGDIPPEMVMGVSTQPDISIVGKGGGTESLPLGGSVPVNERIVVYIETNASCTACFTCIFA